MLGPFVVFAKIKDHVAMPWITGFAVINTIKATLPSLTFLLSYGWTSYEAQRNADEHPNFFQHSV